MQKKKIKEPYWEVFDDIKYIRIDFEGLLNDDEKVVFLTKCAEMILDKEDNSVCALLGIRDNGISPSLINRIKELGKEIQPKMKKSAVVGSVGLLSLFLRTYIIYTGSNMKFFTNKNIALQYITSN